MIGPSTMARHYSPSEEHLLTGAFGSALDGMPSALREIGYTRKSRYALRVGGVHVAVWCERRGIEAEQFDEAVLARFVSHLRRCRCGILQPDSGHQRRRDVRAARHVLRYLRSQGVAAPAAGRRWPPLVVEYLAWLSERGIREPTAAGYAAVVTRLVAALGPDPRAYDAAGLRRFLARYPRKRNPQLPTARGVLVATRSVLRFLVVHGRCAASLLGALPKIARWRNGAVPQSISAAAVATTVSAPDSHSASGMRDHAILLLLARLGLRGGEVARLRLSDIDSTRGRVRIVASKSGHVDLLPMPRDVQNSIVRYLERGRPRTADDHVFVRNQPPFVAGASASMISQVVERTLRKAGVTAPNRGAYVFRHSLATKLLRAGWTLQAIGALLRHRHEETTAIYAKVDFGTLRAVVRRWPERAASK